MMPSEDEYPWEGLHGFAAIDKDGYCIGCGTKVCDAKDVVPAKKPRRKREKKK